MNIHFKLFRDGGFGGAGGLLSSVDPATALGGLGLGVLGSIGQIIGMGSANKQLKTLEANDPANSRASLAQTLLNARMPGAAQEQQNIYANRAATIGNINRNATDSTQATALAGNAEGVTNEAFNKLGIQEAQSYPERLQLLQEAQDKAFQDKAQIQGAINANKQNAWGSVANGGFSLANFGMNGGLNKIFPGGGGSGLNNGTSLNYGSGIPNQGGSPQIYNSTGYIDPNSPGYLTPEYQNPFQIR